MTRPYTKRKGQDIPYQTHSIMHDEEKLRKKASKNFEEMS